MRKKKMYWHIVTWVHPDAKGREHFFTEGEIAGFSEKRTEAYLYDPEAKGFYVAAKFDLLGITPSTYHEEYPLEAIARIDLWVRQHHARVAGTVG